jgi:O-antigen/teichoic acid export membrane protein
MNPIQRIARNSAAPIIAQLINKVVDLGFIYVVLRLLGPVGNGEYAFAVNIWLYAKTFTDFGLGVLATRDVARDHTLANEYLGLTTILRQLLWLATLPVIGSVTLAYYEFSRLTIASVMAILLLTLSIVPDSYSDAANAIFNAYERMEIPAALTVVKNILKVGIGLACVAAGWGAAGLALTALITNLITTGLFVWLLRRLGVRAAWTLPGAQARQMLRDASPLFLNNLLAGLFFRVDILVLQPARGAAEVGIYDAAYKFLSLVLIIPQYFTLALFPHLARLAANRDAAFAATYNLAIKLLLALALPIAVATTFLAPDLMSILGGAAFLPDAGIALRILIWFLPLSYVNGVVQYVLIAAGQQRALFPAFLATAGFNVVANLIFTPLYGFKAAAAITIGSEIVLIVPFLLLVQRRIGPLPPLAIALRPLFAAVLMGVVTWVCQALLGGPTVGYAPWVAVGIGGAVYLGALLASGAIGLTERRLALRLLGRAA